MNAFSISPECVTPEATVGRVLCHDLVSVGELGRVKLGKGHVVRAEDVAALQSFERDMHLLHLDQDDIHEDEAALRLACAVAGEGIETKGPTESQVQLRAMHRGLLEVNIAALNEINLVPDVSVFTAYDGQPVTAGKPVGATKVTPLAVSGEVMQRAELIAAAHAPIIRVRPFLGGSVGVVVRERLTKGNRDKFEAAINMKVGWCESTIDGICYLPDDVTAIVEALQSFLSRGVSLILAAGVNSTDPLDLTIQALDQIGAQTERRGVPAHPGSTCWLAYAGDVPIFGLALCGMFARTTVLDLLLPRFLSGRSVRALDIAQLGHGGLLGKEMSFRFPPYGSEPS